MLTLSFVIFSLVQVPVACKMLTKCAFVRLSIVHNLIISVTVELLRHDARARNLCLLLWLLGLFLGVKGVLFIHFRVVLVDGGHRRQQLSLPVTWR